MITQKNNYFIITGAPGVGKTTLIQEFRSRGQFCIDEPARKVLAEQREINGTGLPEKNPKKFAELLLAHSIRSYCNYLDHSGIVIFDRGIVDSIGYASLFGIDLNDFEIESKKYRYNQKVFVLSPWQEIYTTDDERKMNFSDAVGFHEKILDAYKRLSYELIFVPSDTVKVRTQFILEEIDSLFDQGKPAYQLDAKTFAAYSQNATNYSKDWLDQPEPTDMYELLKKYFIPNGHTIDVGCGNGRDATWLYQSGYPSIGCDSSQELIEIARNLTSQIQFKISALPALLEIESQFDNVLCETVIMHLSRSQILEAIKSLKRILRKNGILYLSWRATEGEDIRHQDGRLYSAYEPSFILDQFPKNSVLHFEDKKSASSGQRVCRLIYKSL